MLWTLCCRNTPDRAQIYFIDGKKSDGGLWANQRLAHNLYEPALGEDDIGLAIERLRSLRQIREDQRVQLGVTKWSEIPAAQRPPLVVAFVSELDLLEKGMPQGEKLEDWLNSELTTCLASGIVYIVSSQTVANRNTRWRQQCLLYLTGFQDVEGAVEPNFGMTSREIEKLGGISPVNFPGPGYFAARINRAVSTVRAAKLDLNDRRSGIAQLPKLPVDTHLVDPLIREKVSMLSTASRGGARDFVPAYRDAPLPADPWLKHALEIDGRTDGTHGIAQPDAAPAGIDQAVIDARRTGLESRLEQGEELSDEDVIFLHQVCGWTPWKLADRGAKRGSKGDRRKKIDAILERAATIAG